ncbi:MAG: hypothetical protein ACI934_000953 [Pseudohongiellaceae bacterium]|jgi:hypothetical protein
MTVLLAADFFIQLVESKVPVEAACVYIRLYKQSVFGGGAPFGCVVFWFLRRKSKS